MWLFVSAYFRHFSGTGLTIPPRGLGRIALKRLHRAAGCLSAFGLSPKLGTSQPRRNAHFQPVSLPERNTLVWLFGVRKSLQYLGVAVEKSHPFLGLTSNRRMVSKDYVSQYTGVNVLKKEQEDKIHLCLQNMPLKVLASNGSDSDRVVTGPSCSVPCRHLL